MRDAKIYIVFFLFQKNITIIFINIMQNFNLLIKLTENRMRKIAKGII